jgi:hypothetical protein
MAIQKKLKMTIPHLIDPSYVGEKCSMCKRPASHKVEQCADEAVSRIMVEGKEIVLPHHPLTNWVCCRCFKKIMGWIVKCA